MRVLFAFVACAALAVIAWLVVPHFRGGPEGKLGDAAAVASRGGARAVVVGAATAKRGDLRLYLSAPGTVTAFNTVTLRARVDGELVSVRFTEGQLVKEDDLLFEIDPRPFQVQLSQAQGQLERDRALLKNASLQLDRFKEAKDAISQQQIDTMLATVNQLEGTIKSDEAAVDAAKLQLTYSRITAPISGRIGLRLVDKGNMIRSNTNDLAVITQFRPIAVVFSLPQDDLASIVTRVDAGAKLPVEAYDRDLKKKLATGELLTFDNQVDQTTGTIRFKAVFKNEDGRLFPNQFVNARLLVDTKKNAVLVPTAAVQRSPRSAFVYVVKAAGADSVVELREVSVGPTEAEETAIEKGLADGEVVVTEGVDKIQSGSKVVVPAKGEKKPPRP